MSDWIQETWNGFEGYEKLAVLVNAGAAFLLVLGVLGTSFYNMMFRNDRFPVDKRVCRL